VTKQTQLILHFAAHHLHIGRDRKNAAHVAAAALAYFVQNQLQIKMWCAVL
jgi:hypothetical protein